MKLKFRLNGTEVSSCWNFCFHLLEQLFPAVKLSFFLIHECERFSIKDGTECLLYSLTLYKKELDTVLPGKLLF